MHAAVRCRTIAEKAGYQRLVVAVIDHPEDQALGGGDEVPW
jgi:hypothetical protein